MLFGTLRFSAFVGVATRTRIVVQIPDYRVWLCTRSEKSNNLERYCTRFLMRIAGKSLFFAITWFPIPHTFWEILFFCKFYDLHLVRCFSFTTYSVTLVRKKISATWQLWLSSDFSQLPFCICSDRTYLIDLKVYRVVTTECTKLHKNLETEHLPNVALVTKSLEVSRSAYPYRR